MSIVPAGTVFAAPGRMSWFRVSRGRLEYRGRITRGPFVRWTRTPEGAAAVARVAQGIRFSLFGRARSARRRMWRALESATRTDSVIAAMRAEADRYLRAAAEISYSDGLPRAHVALHRVVLVPRAMIAGMTRRGMGDRLGPAAGLGEVDESARRFFLDRLLIEMDAALQKGAPSPGAPVHAHAPWSCVGVTGEIVWGDPIWSGPYGTGHVFMYEYPAAGLPRRDRKALEAAIQELNSRVSSLSRNQRFELARAASQR